jgi:hypothetical protein
MKMVHAARTALLCRCPNTGACDYEGRQQSLVSFVERIACHTYTANHNGTNAENTGTWNIEQPCIFSQIADSLHIRKDLAADTTLEDYWMTVYPQCSPGYTGFLCTHCEDGFGRGQAAFSCTQCPEWQVSIIVLLAGFLGVMVLLGYTIRSALLPQLDVQPDAPSSTVKKITQASKPSVLSDNGAAVVEGAHDPGNPFLQAGGSWLGYPYQMDVTRPVSHSAPAVSHSPGSHGSTKPQPSSEQSTPHTSTCAQTPLTEAVPKGSEGWESHIPVQQYIPHGKLQHAAAMYDQTTLPPFNHLPFQPTALICNQPLAAHAMAPMAPQALHQPSTLDPFIFRMPMGPSHATAAPLMQHLDRDQHSVEPAVAPPQELAQNIQALQSIHATFQCPAPTLHPSTPEDTPPVASTTGQEPVTCPAVGSLMPAPPDLCPSEMALESLPPLKEAAAETVLDRGSVVLEPRCSCAAPESISADCSPRVCQAQGTYQMNHEPSYMESSLHRACNPASGAAANIGLFPAEAVPTLVNMGSQSVSTDSVQARWAPKLEIQMIKVVISYLQVISVVRDIELVLPARLQKLFQVQGFTTGWARVLAWDCHILKHFHDEGKSIGRVVVVMMLPIIFHGFWTCFWVGRFAWHRVVCPEKRLSFLKYVRTRVTVTALCVSFILYPVVSGATFSVFSCIDAPDAASNVDLVPFPTLRRNVGQFWSEDTHMKCWTGSHRYASCTSCTDSFASCV